MITERPETADCIRFAPNDNFGVAVEAGAGGAGPACDSQDISSAAPRTDDRTSLFIVQLLDSDTFHSRDRDRLRAELMREGVFLGILRDVNADDGSRQP